jgi:hypothetical protein
MPLIKQNTNVKIHNHLESKKDLKWVSIGKKFGAAEKTRTSTPVKEQRPQRCASTNSATAALPKRGPWIAKRYWNVKSKKSRSEIWFVICAIKQKCQAAQYHRSDHERRPSPPVQKGTWKRATR